MGQPSQQTLPAHENAERAILGGILLDNSLFSQVADVLKRDDFALEAHRRIYAGICRLIKGGRSVDMITLVEELDTGNETDVIGGVGYLSSLIDGLPERPSIDCYVQIVREKSALRRLALAGEQLQVSACSKHPDLNLIASTLRSVAEDVGHVIDYGTPIQRLEDVPEVHSLNAAPISYIAPDLIARGAVVLITGSPGVGKSSLALKLAVACAAGREFLGRFCEQLKVVYLDKENPLALVKQRMDVLAGDRIPDLRIWGGWLPEEPPSVDDPRLLIWAAEHKPLIVFDSLVRFHKSDENSASEMRTVMGRLRRLADAGATVLVLHHRSKTDGSKYRGSSDILAAVDMAYALEEVGGLLRLHRFKSRFSAEEIFPLRANFATGAFEVLGERVDPESAEDSKIIRKIIADRPGLNTRAICAAAKPQGVSRSRTLAALKRGTGRLWRQESGGNRSVHHYLLDSVPGAPPHEAAERRSTPNSQCSAGVPRTLEHTDNKADDEADSAGQQLFDNMHCDPQARNTHASELKLRTQK